MASYTLDFVYHFDSFDVSFCEQLASFVHEDLLVSLCYFMMSHGDRCETARILCLANGLSVEDFDRFYVERLPSSKILNL
jgi:hypothetical protein